jgi:hypothetical protein
MPALNEAQRQRQIAIAKQGKAKPKAKPGQKGVPTSGGAKTKAGTIGGGNPNTPRPVAKTKPKPTPSNKPKPIGDGKGGLSKPSGTTGRTTPQSTTARRPSASSRPQSQFAGARDANLDRINSDPRFAAPQPVQRRSPAIGAPVHASPSAFGSAPKLAQSAYVGSSAASPARPSTPGQAVQQQATNPYAGIGDVRNQQLPQSPIQQDAQPVAGTQEYGGNAVQGVNENGIDEERRRAFLDADNSLDGLKAVKELLNRRKLSISVEN